MAKENKPLKSILFVSRNKNIFLTSKNEDMFD